MSEPLTPKQQAFLHATASITDIAKGYFDSVTMERISEGWQASESDHYHRAIIMRGDGQPIWYAETTIPRATFNKREQDFAGLGEATLGSLLFTDKGIKRQSLQVNKASAKSPLYLALLHYLPDAPPELLQRQHVYLVDGEPLYLNEIFLPFLWQHLC